MISLQLIPFFFYFIHFIHAENQNTCLSARPATVLVTGGSGLVGKAIESLIEKEGRGLNWVFLNSSTLNLAGDYTLTRNYFEQLKPRFVIHLAARVGGLYRNENSNLEMFLDNMKINENVLKAANEFNVEKVVLCLSTCIYPDKIQYPFDESTLHNGPPHPSNEGYAYAKRMLALQAKLYNQRKSSPRMLCVVPTNIHGPYDNFNLEDSHVIPGLIHRAYLAKRNNEPFVVRGGGKAVRQFIHSTDVARLILRVLYEMQPEQMPHGMILAPPAEAEITIAEVAKVVLHSFLELILFFQSNYAISLICVEKLMQLGDR